MTVWHPTRNDKGIIFGPVDLQIINNGFSFALDTDKNGTVSRTIVLSHKTRRQKLYKSCHSGHSIVTSERVSVFHFQAMARVPFVISFHFL